jgi:glycosyltransferase involved in cell wall biosynthesis
MRLFRRQAKMAAGARPAAAFAIMRILLVNDYGTLAGGAEVIVFGLRDALRDRGHDVRVFTSSARAGGGDSLADDHCFGTTSRWRTLVQSANLAAAGPLRAAIARFEPDVVHVNLYLTQLSPLVLRALDGVAAVYYAQWYRAICPLGTRRLPGGDTCAATAGTACLRSGCVPPWDWPPLMAQMTLDRAWGGRFARVTAISGAVATRLDRFGAPHLRGAMVVHPGTPVVEPRQDPSRLPTAISAGRLVPEKGIDVLVRAFALVARRHPEARLVVAGDGPERTPLERLANRLGVRDRVEFRGQLSRDATLAAIRAAWVACVPSVWEEPFGMVAAEAQMHGVAVVASRSGGLSEIVVDGTTGHLVPPGDADALAARLDALFADRGAAVACGARGHERAREHFSLDGFAGRFEHVYDDALAAHGGRA